MGNNEDTTIYKIVVNHEEHYSIWPTASENPLGWRDVGRTGLKNECLAYIKELWTDMKPFSLRKKMEATARRGNDTETDYARDVCIQHLFETQAERIPDAVAVVCDNQQLTYQELNRRANQLAHHLHKQRVGPEVNVGICVERSIEMVVCVLGILKAGGAYVPLDPMYPKDRLDFMIREPEVPLLLTQERLLKKLPEHGAQVICLDRDWPLISQQNEGNANTAASEASLAYVIYTSGSTGMPKGVMVTHVSLRHYVQDLQKALGIISDDVYLHTASISFSSSVRQLMLPLAKGATVAMATSEQRTNPLALFEMIKRQDVTIMDTGPSFLQTCTHALLRLKPQARKIFLENKLRLILTTGEPLPYHVVKNWSLDFEHGARFVNMYGTTETSGSVAVNPISAKNDCSEKIVPLGRPIANTKIYILDQNLQPAPAGTSGELYVGGLRVARAYLNRVELTATSFIPDPFSDEPGARMWKTGDLAHYLSDGSIGFIGRIDHLIIIRGSRVEPAEVEEVLKQHPAVWETVVVARDDEPGNTRLVAYMVHDPEESLTVSELRRLLIEKLPDYMVPTAFVMLDALPRLPSGKIDRQALPAPDQRRPDLDQPYVSPRSELQRHLSNLWCDILKLDRVGIYDRFFELGGTSILAARFVNIIQVELDESIPIISIFESSSIAEYTMFLKKHYAQAVARRFPHELGLGAPPQAGKSQPKHKTMNSRREFSERQRQFRLAHRESKLETGQKVQ
jgi:amino acid adenylation domain-containing protein